MFTFPGSPALWARSFTLIQYNSGWVVKEFSHREERSFGVGPVRK